MSIETQYNLRSPSVKRLMREALELASPTEEYYACPLEDNLFEWHFTVRGPPSTEFEGGFYHGRILLPSQYPMQPPNIILLTPNGRFEINKKICLSISGHHPESWQPSWSIRTALLALIAFMPTNAAGTIGSLDYTPDERQILAKKSKNWECSVCGKIANKLASGENVNKPVLTEEETSLIQNIALKAEEEANRKEVNKEVEGDNVTAVESTGDPQKQDSDTSFGSLRQRITTEEISGVDSVANLNNQTVVTGVLQTEIIQSGNKDKIWTALMCFIIMVIILLIIRRLFFL